jgi:hypothetical protein
MTCTTFLFIEFASLKGLLEEGRGCVLTFVEIDLSPAHQQTSLPFSTSSHVSTAPLNTQYFLDTSFLSNAFMKTLK